MGVWGGATPPLKAKTGDAARPACPHRTPGKSQLSERLLDVGIFAANQTRGSCTPRFILIWEGAKRGAHTGARSIAASHPPRAARMASAAKRRGASGKGDPLIDMMGRFFRLWSSSEDHNLRQKSSKDNRTTFVSQQNRRGEGGAFVLLRTKSHKVCAGRPGGLWSLLLSRRPRTEPARACRRSSYQRRLFKKSPVRNRHRALGPAALHPDI